MKSIYRLKKDADFKALISKRQITRSTSFILYQAENKLDHLRVGVSVSKKIGNAVVRNKIRRQMKAILFKQLNFTDKKDLLFVIKADYKKFTFHAIQEEIQKHLVKIRRPIN